MVKIFGLVFVLVSLLVPMFSCTVLRARNVTVVQNNAQSSFLFEAINAGIDTDKKAAAIDIVAFLAQKNVLIYEHFAEVARYNGGNITDAAAANFAFLLGFFGAVEYLELNGIPGLQVVGWNAKSGISDLPLSAYYNNTAGDIDWEITSSSQLTQFPDGGIARVYELTFATSDGVFNYTVTYAGRELNVGKVVIDANSFKIGFNINYYQYSGASTNPLSRICLVLVVGSSRAAAKQINGNGDTVSNVKVQSGAYSGFINFENTAQTWDIFGTQRTAEVTFGYVDQYGTGVGIADWTSAALFLSYNATRPQTISYDPEIGAQIPENSSAISSLNAPSFALTIFVLFGLIFALF